MKLAETSSNGTFLTGKDAYFDRYESWGGAKGLGAKVGAFVDGSANFLKALGLAPQFSIALMGDLLTLCSFFRISSS